MNFSEWVSLQESDTPEVAFIQSIHKNPHDQLTWLAYADWLEERGDPRADAIRKSKMKPSAKRRGLVNYTGESQYQTFPAWKRAVQTMFPGVSFEGNKDVAQASFHGMGVGEWDGETGHVYSKFNPPMQRPGLSQ